MLDATLRESLRLRSVKKFFIDKFNASIPVFFDVIEDAPKVGNVVVDKWMSVTIRSTSLGTLASSLVYVYLFVNNDSDGSKMAELVDVLTDSLINLEENDGRQRIIIYDADWNEAYHSVVALLDPLETITLENRIKTKLVPFSLYWGAK